MRVGRSVPGRYGAALLSVLVAVAVRAALQPFLGIRYPLPTFFVATVFAAWFGGFFPALFALVLGYGVAVYLFVPPFHSLRVQGLDNQIGLALYLFIGLVSAFFSEAQQRAAAALRTERERLAVTLQSIGDAVIGTDSEGRVTLLNRVAEALTGWTQAEARGRHLDDIFPILNEQTRKPVDHPVDRVLQSDAVVGLANHTVLVHRDGREIPIEDSAAPIRTPQGEIQGVVLVFRDVTERRAVRAQLEQHYRVLSLVHGLIRSMEGRILLWTPGAERMYGWTKAEAEGQMSHQLLQTTFSEPLDAINARLLETGQWEGELTHRRADGSAITVVSHWALAGGGRSEGDWVLEVSHDISAQKRAEAALRDADRRKDEFLAMLAHELRNPLAPILTALHLIRRDHPADPSVDRIQAIVERQVQHMARLIDDLLDVSRITRGHVVLRKKAVDLVDLIDNTVDAFRAPADRKGLELSVRKPGGSVWIQADPTRVEQVLSNLMGNAVKFTDAPGQVTVELRREGGEAVIVVHDTGQGMTLEVQEHLFDLFYQADRSLDRAQGGLGIGLTIVKHLVEQHGGTVTARSAGAGQGSTMEVRLPALGSTPGDSVGLSLRPATGSPQRVLVVEDNRDGADMLAAALAGAGHVVEVAYDGPTAVALAEDYRPDTVVLDIGLPGMDGYEVARRLRAGDVGGEMTLIALTGYGQEEDIRRAMEAGFDAHLVKPVEFEDLETVLARGAWE